MHFHQISADLSVDLCVWDVVIPPAFISQCCVPACVWQFSTAVCQQFRQDSGLAYMSLSFASGHTIPAAVWADSLSLEAGILQLWSSVVKAETRLETQQGTKSCGWKENSNLVVFLATKRCWKKRVVKRYCNNRLILYDMYWIEQTKDSIFNSVPHGPHCFLVNLCSCLIWCQQHVWNKLEQRQQKTWKVS